MPPLRWSRNRGRNGWESAIDVPEDMSTETLNCHFYEGGLGTRRGGSVEVTVGGTAPVGYNAVRSWVPGQDETARELLAVDASVPNQVLRMAAGSSYAALTVGDQIAAGEFSFASINGKLYLAYNSAVNRLHVFDPGFSTTALRRAGMGTPAAPTAVTMGGIGLTFDGTYKVAYTEQRSSVTVRRSALSASVTVSIANDAGITVNKPATISEGETHWEVYRLHTDDLYYLIATTAVGTLTYDDTSATVDTTTAEPTAGENTPWPSVKYLYSDGKTLFGLGVYETAAGDSHTPQAGTVYHSPALDSSGIHDDERVRNTATAVGRVILGRNAGGVDRGIGGLGNVVYAFQSKGIYQLTPTENPDVRFRRVQLDDELGAVNHASIAKYIDQHGKPALYFVDPTYGPYRIGQRGIEWVGKDVKDLWDGVNLAATHVAWAEVLPEIGALLVAFATGASDDPDTILMYDPTEARYDEQGDLRGGWSKWTGTLCEARCATQMSATLGASMSRDLTLYVGASSGTTLLKYDASAEDDDGDDFQAYVESKAWDLDPFYQDKALLRSYVHASAQSGVTITQTLVRNFGDETSRTSEVSLTPQGGETRTLQKFDEASLADAYTFQVRLGDGDAQPSAFTLDRWYGEIKMGSVR